MGPCERLQAHRLEEAQVVADQHADVDAVESEHREPEVPGSEHVALASEEVQLAVTADEIAVAIDHRNGVVEGVAVAFGVAADHRRGVLPCGGAPRAQRRSITGRGLGHARDRLALDDVSRRDELWEHDERRVLRRRLGDRGTRAGGVGLDVKAGGLHLHGGNDHLARSMRAALFKALVPGAGANPQPGEYVRSRRFPPLSLATAAAGSEAGQPHGPGTRSICSTNAHARQGATPISHGTTDERALRRDSTPMAYRLQRSRWFTPVPVTRSWPDGTSCAVASFADREGPCSAPA